MSSPNVHVFADQNAVMTALIEALAAWTQEGVRTRGQSDWAISGGSTPIPLYRLLGEGSGALPWPAIRLYFADERDVYPTDPLSNYYMVQEELLNRMPTPPARVFGWPVVHEPRQAMSWYRAALAQLPRVDHYPQLDLALLGMGGDGHTASVFPGSPQQSSLDWVAYGPGPRASRFTLSLPLLGHAGHVVFLATGAGKASRVRECLSQEDSQLPAAWVSTHAADVHWFLDSDSAREL